MIGPGRSGEAGQKGPHGEEGARFGPPRQATRTVQKVVNFAGNRGAGPRRARPARRHRARLQHCGGSGRSGGSGGGATTAATALLDIVGGSTGCSSERIVGSHEGIAGAFAEKCGRPTFLILYVYCRIFVNFVLF